ncbi:MAG: hypothetical protein WC860_08350 [Candidatus Margulisiibacteriota bacterium]|jgi:hypothetical protein
MNNNNYELDDFKFNLQLLLSNCRNLYNSEALWKDELNIFAESVFTKILIQLNDILQKLKKCNLCIIWQDDINKEDGNITDLVSKLRNASCHIDSNNNHINKNKKDTKFVFNKISGNSPNAFKRGNLVLGCNYKDDIAFYYGEYRIYLKRHIERLIKELPQEIEKINQA